MMQINSAGRKRPLGGRGNQGRVAAAHQPIPRLIQSTQRDLELECFDRAVAAFPLDLDRNRLARAFAK